MSYYHKNKHVELKKQSTGARMIFFRLSTQGLPSVQIILPGPLRVFVLFWCVGFSVFFLFHFNQRPQSVTVQ